MTHYKSNLRDIEFNLFEANRLESYLSAAPFEEFDHETVMDLLREIDRLAREDFAASFVDADRNPPRLEDGRVLLSDAIKASLDAYYEGGWDRLAYPTELGGYGAPPSLNWAVEELLVGANPGIYFYVSGGMMAGVLGEEGTPQRRSMAGLMWVPVSPKPSR